MDALVPLHDAAHPQQLPSSLSVLSSALSRPLTPAETERLVQLDRLRQFLATAPSHWSSSSTASSARQPQHAQLSHAGSTHPALNRFLLPSGEYVSCVLWSGLYHITGTDIVRALVFRFEAFGRPVVNMKKFEEGVFSDLRNLKPGTDACLEEPKSPFLDLLFKYQCIRTQKKQKVFYWFSVPHDRLFLDALERDLKREKMGLEVTTVPRGEPSLSFTYDPKRTLYEQFLKPPSSGDGEGADEEDELKSAMASPTVASFGNRGLSGLGSKPISVVSPADIMSRKLQATAALSGFKEEDQDGPVASTSHHGSQAARNKHIFLNMFSIFEGSPTYKQRRKKAGSNAGAKAQVLGTSSSSGPELAKRRSTLMSEAVISRRNSTLTLSGGADPAGSSHLSHYGSEHPASRPQSSQQHIIQQLPSYGLSMNPTVERSITDDPQPSHGDEYAHMHPSLQPSGHASIQPPDAAAINGTATTKAFVCPLLMCRRLFRSAEQLKKHMSVHSTSALVRAGSGGLRFPCNRPGCQKVFTRADTLNLHKQSCAGWDTRPSTASEQVDQLEEESGDMDIGHIQEIEVPVDSKFEDEPPMSAGGYSSVSPPPHGANPQRIPPDLNLSHLQHSHHVMPSSQENGSGAPQFAVVPTSAETSPYVETPDASSALLSHSLVNGYHYQHHHHHLNHYPSHPNIGSIASPPGSAHSHSSVGGRSVFMQQQAQGNLHPARFQSPEFGLYNYAGQPSSAPSHKATFDQSSLYPPIHSHHRQTGGMVGVSLRRYRSAAPAMTGTSGAGGLRMGNDGRPLSTHPMIDSRPASSAGESNYDYGTVIVNSSMLGQGQGNTFAYSIDSGDGQGATMSYVPPDSAAMSGVGGEPGSEHSSPMSYGNGTLGAEYGDSNSPYDGSNGGSPGSVGGQVANVPMMAPVAMVHPMHDHPAFQMRGHAHSLSSEIATQQMQQYVDLDGLAGESESTNMTTGAPASYSHHASQQHQQQYQDDRRPDVAAYAGHPEAESHEELYQYHYQSHPGASLHDRAMHRTQQPVPYGYPTTMEQPVSL